ncbi:MAG: hypothetical protein A4E63_01857 [Syntrophorhabdus sp. PtaU1.Bin050]|nr:MAG: hypothetical protein A4E63_01857 [Syntrophorhabdus sp. PtaU1.Bin050]
MVDVKVTFLDSSHISFNDAINIIQTIVTTIAILVGGLWSYFLFVKKRQRFPRASISHQIFHKPILDGKIFLNVKTIINNTGDVLLCLESGIVRVQRILPVSPEMADSFKNISDPVPQGEKEVDWPLIGTRPFQWEKGNCEIEPGENDHFVADYIIDGGIQLVAIYSHFQNTKKHNRDIGWGITTIYDLKK